MSSAGKRMLNHQWPLLFMLAGACATSSDDTNIAIGFGARPPLTAEMLHATASFGDRAWRIEGSGMAPAPGFGHIGPHLSMPAQGNFTFSFVLIGTKSDTVTSGSVTIELRPNWNWGLSLEGPMDNSHSCTGCAQYAKAFPLPPAYRNSDRDSLWIIWTGLEH